MGAFIKIINCTLCDCEITNDTDSKEHIIPQAIGGRLKVKGFICRDCNNKSGKSWDAKLASQLNFFNLIVGVTREKGDARSQRVENVLQGNELVLRADGSYTIPQPKYEVTYDGSIPQISIQAANNKQFKQQLARAKKEFPKLDVDKQFNQAKVEDDFSVKVLKTSFECIEDKQSGRSVIKSCLALATYHGIKTQICSAGLEYLRNPDAKPCFGYFYARDLVPNRPLDTVFHCVAIAGYKESGQLLGYIEYFGIHRIVAILSDNYEGQNFTHVYAIDPISARDIKIEVNLFLSKKDIEDIYSNNQLYDGSMDKAFQQVMPIIQANKNRKREKQIIDKAFEYAWDNCGANKDEILTEEHIRNLSDLFAEKIVQLFYS